MRDPCLYDINWSVRPRTIPRERPEVVQIDACVKHIPDHSISWRAEGNLTVVLLFGHMIMTILLTLLSIFIIVKDMYQ